VKARIVAAVAAVLLAVLGIVLLTGYVSSADQRALAGVESIDVLVVQAPIPQGTAAENLSGQVAREKVPAKTVPADAITNVAQIAGQVTTVALVPGEQLLAGRFADPASLKTDDPAPVAVPEGDQEVTIQLDPQRVKGGQLTPGDTVGVFISLDSTVSNDPAGAVTHLTLQKVLVTSVQGLPASSTATTDKGTAPAAVPEGGVLVTLAIRAPDAEKVVFGSEFGKVWLSKEPLNADESGTRKVTRENVYS
jgi:pilus assembly protein CpaB